MKICFLWFLWMMVNFSCDSIDSSQENSDEKTGIERAEVDVNSGDQNGLEFEKMLPWSQEKAKDKKIEVSSSDQQKAELKLDPLTSTQTPSEKDKAMPVASFKTTLKQVSSTPSNLGSLVFQVSWEQANNADSYQLWYSDTSSCQKQIALSKGLEYKPYYLTITPSLKDVIYICVAAQDGSDSIFLSESKGLKIETGAKEVAGCKVKNPENTPTLGFRYFKDEEIWYIFGSNSQANGDQIFLSGGADGQVRIKTSANGPESVIPCVRKDAKGMHVINGKMVLDMPIIVFTRAGHDVVKAHESADGFLQVPVRLIGGLGDDELHGGIKNDVISGGHGVDKIYGHEGNDLLSTDVMQGRKWTW